MKDYEYAFFKRTGLTLAEFNVIFFVLLGMIVIYVVCQNIEITSVFLLLGVAIYAYKKHEESEAKEKKIKREIYLINKGLSQAKKDNIQCLQAYNLPEGGWLLVEKVVMDPSEKVYLRILQNGEYTDSWYEFVQYDKEHDELDYKFGGIKHNNSPYRYFRFRDDYYVLNDDVTQVTICHS